MRMAIPPADRLTDTLRFLATGKCPFYKHFYMYGVLNDKEFAIKKIYVCRLLLIRLMYTKVIDPYIFFSNFLGDICFRHLGEGLCEQVI